MCPEDLTAGANIDDASPLPATRGLSVAVPRVLGMALVAGILSLVAALVSLRLTSESLRLPLGRDDAVALYQAANTTIRFGWFTWNPDIGYPYGMDASHIPNPEVHEWLVLKLITMLSADPFLALNTYFLFGFFSVGCFSYLLFLSTVRLEWFALLLSVAAATLPWHFARLPHALLADYSPVPIALLLAYLMWNRRWVTSNGRFALAIAGAVFVGTGGVYYALFACILLGPVLLWRIASERRVTRWWRDAAVAFAIPTALLASMGMHGSLSRMPSAGSSYARSALESLVYSGDVLTLFLPWPLANAHIEGNARLSILGAMAVTASVGILLALAVARYRGPARMVDASVTRELVPWLRLFVWSLLWFAPGLGFVFALLVSPSIRSWGRMSIVILYISFVIGGIALRALTQARPRWRVASAVGLSVLLVGQVAMDYSSLLAPWSSGFDAEAKRYAAGLRSLVNRSCPILQLPIMKFPEAIWPTDRMAPYDHMWMQIYAPEFRWSFGVVTGTRAAEASQKRYSEKMDLAQIVHNADQDGYCAIHVDRLGMTPARDARLSTVLGKPDLEVGRWALYQLHGARE